MWNEFSIMRLRVQLDYALDARWPDLNRIGRLIDAIHVAKARRPVWIANRIEERRLERARKS